MKLIVKFGESIFKSQTFKDAYLDACKWVAKNIMNKHVEIGEVLHKIEKVVDDEYSNLPTVRLELYAVLDDRELVTSLCEACVEFHNTFYINQQYNCNACNMTSYKKHVETRLRGIKQYRRERLNYIINK